MTVTAALSLLLAISKAIPVIDKWLEELAAAYVKARVSAMKKETREAIKKALEIDDQRTIEETIGSSSAGQPTGAPGSVIVDSLPGVKP